MKKGFYPKLAFDGIRKNKKMYLPYILNRYYECFPEKYYAEIVFVHSENVIKSEFLFAPFDKKRICVKKEDA